MLLAVIVWERRAHLPKGEQFLKVIWKPSNFFYSKLGFLWVLYFVATEEIVHKPKWGQSDARGSKDFKGNKQFTTEDRGGKMKRN